MPVPLPAVRRFASRARSRKPELERLQQRNARLTKRVAALEAKRRSLRTQLDEALARTTAVPAIDGVSRLDLRRACALASTGPDVSILEIGPAHNAIFAKRDGFDTRTVDYLDREGLIDRYASFDQYSPDDIEDVDYVLPPGAAMSDIIPDRFDLVMASHVIEHTTSMIDFLTECSRLLAPGGVLALVVPDHRYCFDRFRERASIARVIEASLAPPPVHTVGAVVEEKLNATRHRGMTAWKPGHRGAYELIFDASDASAEGEEARRAERYIDTHNWVCTPHHLRLLLQDLHDLGLTQLREVSFHDTVRHEFFLNLSHEGPGTGLTREELLVLSENERRSVDVPTFKTLGTDVSR
ncbi:MAG: methyltransferase domain-containing protein [Nocardioides sp.]